MSSYFEKKRHYANAFQNFLKGQSKTSRCFPAVFLHSEQPENDRFLFIKAWLTAGKHICSINLNAFPELRRFSAEETFY